MEARVKGANPQLLHSCLKPAGNITTCVRSVMCLPIEETELVYEE